VWIGRRRRVRPGQLFAGYVAGYAAGRLWVEALRIDPATEILGLRVNLWVSLLVLMAAFAVMVVRHCKQGEGVELSDADAGGAGPKGPERS
jgi:prolipoprotein diacylglyceryltransferase